MKSLTARVLEWRNKLGSPVNTVGEVTFYDSGLVDIDYAHVSYEPGWDYIEIDGTFRPDELRALADHIEAQKP